jgi:hypothetical protein
MFRGDPLVSGAAINLAPAHPSVSINLRRVPTPVNALPGPSSGCSAPAIPEELDGQRRAIAAFCLSLVSMIFHRTKGCAFASRAQRFLRN